MKESRFIQKNKKVWEEYEMFQKGTVSLGPRKSVQLYLKIISDLSYARTFYRSSPIVPYLNGLARRAHGNIYKHRGFDRNQLVFLFNTQIPLAFKELRSSFLLAGVLFILFCVIGFLSASMEPQFVRMILGDAYVDMTLFNIDNDDPMAVYSSMESTSMSLRIGINNIMVSFNAYAYGILASLGTIYILLFNGVMVGAFLQFFAGEGIFWTAFTTIMIHGTLELTAIVIAGGAGIELGRSWMFPGTYPRLTSLRIGALKTLKVIIGLIPVFILAAIIESFVTRWYIEMGIGLRLLVIILSIVFIFYYFIHYPNKVYERESKDRI